MSRCHAKLSASSLFCLLATLHAAPAQETPGIPREGWNNSYSIEVELLTATRTLLGRETVIFTNRGTLPVTELYFHLYAQGFSNDHSTYLRQQRSITGRDPLEGHDLESARQELGYCWVKTLTIDGATPDLEGADRSLMRVSLQTPLAPESSVRVEIEFETRLPRTIARMGWFGDHYDVMQWFPKLAAHGNNRWNALPFHMTTEFFANFGDYAVTIVTPEPLVVGATGVLQEEEALPAEDGKPARTRRRYRAESVIDFAWCADPHFQLFPDTFTAPSGHTVDIRYLCQPYAVEKAPLVLAMTRRCLELYGEWFKPYPYPSLTIDGLPLGLGGGMEYPMLITVSQRFPTHLPYLEHTTEEPAGVTAHEFGHQYWYGLLASNEFTEAWLDEGVNTYVTSKIEEEFWGTQHGRPLPSLEWREFLQPFLDDGLGLTLFDRPLGLRELVGFEESPFSTVRRGRASGPTLLGYSVPTGRIPGFHVQRLVGRRERYAGVAATSAIRTTSYTMHPESYSPIVYSKTALALATLERLFGWDAMRTALREYTERYWFAHPTGDDFLGVLREVIPREVARKAGPQAETLDLNTWLVPFFETNQILDFAVTEVRTSPVAAPRGWVLSPQLGDQPSAQFAGPPEESEEARHEYQVLVENLGQMEIPVNILLVFEDGTRQVEHWDGKGDFLWLEPDEPVTSPLRYATVDPYGALLLDINHNNNGRCIRRNREAVRLYQRVLLFWSQQYLTGLRALLGT